MSNFFTYKTSGICSIAIEISYNNDIIENVRFVGGCRGNTLGVAALVKGMRTEEAIAKLEGIECRNGTSCPDQLAKALKTII